MLELSNLAVNYGSITALHDVSLNVETGAIVTLIGANGAGKSTTLRTVSGLLKARHGNIRYEGEEISNLPPHRIVERGISQVPEGRMIFANLTVRENLLMGAYLRKDRNKLGSDFDFVFEIFPRLKERAKQVAGTLSGGEQHGENNFSKNRRDQSVIGHHDSAGRTKRQSRARGFALRLRAGNRANYFARSLECPACKRAREKRVLRRPLRPNYFRQILRAS